MDLPRVIQAILSRVHEREGYVTKTKLLKYLYLFDLETYRRTGRVLTGFEWIFHLYGPWAPQYDGLYADLVRSGGVRVTPGTRPELDTEFLSSPRRVELQDVVEDVGLELAFRHIVDDWADRRLGEMLDYVYFHTEPMLEAKRGERLDFKHVAGPHEPLALPDRTIDRRQVEQLRRRIAARRPTDAPSESFTPPHYDAAYFDALQVISEDDGD